MFGIWTINTACNKAAVQPYYEHKFEPALYSARVNVIEL